MKKAYQVFKGLNVCDYELIVRLFTPYNYGKYYEELSEEHFPGKELLYNCFNDSEKLKLVADKHLNGNIDKAKSLLTKLKLFFSIPSKMPIDKVLSKEPIDIEPEWTKLKDELFQLQKEDRESYVSALIADLQRKYESLAVRWNRCQDKKIVSNALKEALETYVQILMFIVSKVGFQLGLCLSKKFIFIQYDMYNQIFVENDCYQDPCMLYPGLKNEMEKQRFFILGQKSKNEDEQIRFFPIFTKDRMIELFRSLINKNMIDANTQEEHFLYWFGIQKDKPQNLRYIRWIRSQVLLAYFINQYHLKLRREEQVNFWSVTNTVFRIKDKRVNINSMSSAMSKMNKEERNYPKGYKEIDEILKK